MQLTQDSGRGQYRIKAYEPGAITINETTYHASLILSPETLITDWSPQSLEELNEQALKQILTLSPEVLLLGTGKHFIMAQPKQLALIHQHKIGVECMDTGAACRTFMALSAEGRNVVAALLIN